MPLSEQAKYTFLPWLKQGVNGLITRQEGDGSSHTGRPIINMEIDLTRSYKHGTGSELESELDTVGHVINLRGPGDVISLSREAVVRLEPQENIQNQEWNYLPHIEFYEEDLPWRYTAATGHAFTSAGDDPIRLTPWMYLLVLQEDEFDLDLSIPDRPALVIRDSVADPSLLFAPHDELWAWAHVQFNRSLAFAQNSHFIPMDELIMEMESDADLAFSRLISPRKLEKDTSYRAFVIPTFAMGRQAGLGEVVQDIDPLTPSWTETDVPRMHPYYISWSFRTAADGDFEHLANKIEPKPTPADKGARYMDIHQAGWGLHATDVQDKALGLESALRPPTFEPAAFLHYPGNRTYVDKLKASVNANVDPTALDQGDVIGDPLDPMVLPPMYGSFQSGRKQITYDYEREDIPWFPALNLDPRHRAVAGLGSTLVKHHQEKMMADAWDQVEEVISANKRIHKAELMRKVGQRAFEKHVKHPLDNSTAAQDRLIRMTFPMHARVARTDQSDSLEKEFTESRVPDTLRAPAFRRFTRPGIKRSKRLSQSMTEGDAPIHFASDILTKADTEHEAGGTHFFPLPKAPQHADSIATLVEDASITENALANGNFEYENTDESVTSFTSQAMALELETNASRQLQRSPAPDALAKLLESTAPAQAVSEKILSTMEVWDDTEEAFVPLTEMRPIMAHPHLDDPLYRYLKELSFDYIIPHAEEFTANSVTLMETNPRFIDALFVGANHEFSRELLWREYPTDQRGTYFKHFWDRTDGLEDAVFPDISDISTWETDASLGEQPDNALSTMVLVIRAELFEKFPDVLVYAQAAKHIAGATPGTILPDTAREIDLDAAPVYPDFKAAIGEDLLLFGFSSLTEQEVRGLNSDGDAYSTLGYYFVFRERPGQTRFGLDDNSETGLHDGNAPINDWNQLAWQMLHTEGMHPVLQKGWNEQLAAYSEQGDWFHSSADMAYILYQAPVMMCIHAADMLEDIRITMEDDPSDPDGDAENNENES